MRQSPKLASEATHVCEPLVRGAIVVDSTSVRSPASVGPARRAGRAPQRGGAFLDEGGLVFGHEGKQAEDELAVGGGVSTMPLVSDLTPTPRFSGVATMSTRSRKLRPSRSIFQMIRVSPGRRSSRHAWYIKSFRCRACGLRTSNRNHRRREPTWSIEWPAGCPPAGPTTPEGWSDIGCPL